MPAPGLGVHLESTISGLSIDPDYPPIQLPGVRPATGGHLFSASQPMQFSMEPAQSTYIVRGQIPDGGPQAGALSAAAAHPDVVGIYSDPVIESCLTCGGTPPVGSDADVAKQLGATRLAANKSRKLSRNSSDRSLKDWCRSAIV